MVQKWKKDLKKVSFAHKNIDFSIIISDLSNRNYKRYDIKPLSGKTNFMRVRIGKYRIIFKDISGEDIEIIAIQKRGDVYKGL